MFRYLLTISSLISLACLATFGTVSGYGPETPIKSPDHLKSEIERSIDLGNSAVEQTAVIVAKDYPGDYNLNQVSEVYDTLRKGWYYYSDPSYKDLYKNANRTLQDGKISNSVGMGDCDDFAILMASLLESLQGSTRIVFAYDQDTGKNHAYAEVYLGKKSDPQVDKLIGWLKQQYNQTEIPGQTIEEDEVWLNLDYDSTYPGGHHFGEKHRTAREVVWPSGSRNPPKIVPIIDAMDSIAGWEKIRDENGSDITITSVPSPKAKAVQMNFDLKEGGWAGMSRNVSGSILSEAKGLNLSYYGLDRQINLQFRLVYKDGTSFGYSWKPGTGNKWDGLEVLFDDFTIVGTGSNSNAAGQKLDPSKAEKLEIVCQLDKKDSPEYGRIIIDHIRGVMNIPPGSPWARAEMEQKAALARRLAAESERIRAQDNSKLQLSLLLAIEAMRMYPCIEADQALRHDLDLLPKRLIRVVHNKEIWKVLFSPDGTKIATASEDGTARIWRINDSKELANITHKDFVDAIAFSPDGSKLATASLDNYSVLWNISDAREIKRLKHNGRVLDAAFNFDGKRLATSCSDRTFRIWDADTGQFLGMNRSPLEDEILYKLKFSPNKNILATVSYPGVSLWDADTCHLLITMAFNSSVNDIAFCSDGSKLAIAEYKTIWIYDVKTGAKTRLDQEDDVKAVEFSPDGTCLATVSQNIVKIWSIPCGREVLKWVHKDNVNDIEFSYDGTKLATGGWDETNGIAEIWDASTGKELARMAHDWGVSSIAFSPKGDKLATASLDNTSAVWDLALGLDPIRLSHHNNTIEYTDDDKITSVAFSPDGHNLVTTSWDKTARIWNATNGKEFERIELEELPEIGFYKLVSLKTDGTENSKITINRAVLINDRRVESASFSPDGTRLAIGYTDGVLEVIDINKSKMILQKNNLGEITTIIFSRDGSKIATASWGSRARIWNSSTGELLMQIPPDDLSEYECYNVAFSQDGKSIAMGTSIPSIYAKSKGIVMIFDINTGKLINNFAAAEERISKVAFSPDGALLATGSWDGTAKIWELSTKKELSRMVHGGAVFDMQFDKSGTLLATASMDHTARIWDAKTGRELSRMLHEYPVSSISLSPDGSRIAAASGDTVYIWLWRPIDLIKTACSRLLRNLTSEERHQYLGEEA
jgi:WD40 repeat protein